MPRLPVPERVQEGIALVNVAIASERRKDYWAAKATYLKAALKIVEGSAAYPEGSSERRQRRQRRQQRRTKHRAMLRRHGAFPL